MAETETVSLDQSLADRRRGQVLDAAAKCFSREGFHGATMATIAGEASLSVGQIYRYFENKEAVIEALVARRLDEWSGRIAAARARSGDLVDEMIEIVRYHVEKVGGPEQAALSLEFLAEAARNPRIAELVRLVDATMRGHLRNVLVRAGATDEATLDSRLNLVAALIDGWPVRSVKNPDVGMEDYLDSLRPLFAILCSPELGEGGAGF